MTKISMKPVLLAAGLLFSAGSGFAQDNLVNALSNNHSTDSKNSFTFTPVINAEATSVKNQQSDRKSVV